MHVVWHTFCEWVDSHEPDETIILVAYNGEKCNCKWLWKLTQAPFSQYNLPTKIKWFMDLLKSSHPAVLVLSTRIDPNLIISEQFAAFINRTNSIQPIERIFGAAQQNDWKKKMEPIIEPREEDQYTGASGGGLMGPPESIRRKARHTKDLLCVLLHILPVSFFEKDLLCVLLHILPVSFFEKVSEIETLIQPTSIKSKVFRHIHRENQNC
eukprot:scaffold15307_cov38-Cyclotella_meneghiniana.AAC.3